MEPISSNPCLLKVIFITSLPKGEVTNPLDICYKASDSYDFGNIG